MQKAVGDFKLECAASHGVGLLRRPLKRKAAAIEQEAVRAIVEQTFTPRGKVRKSDDLCTPPRSI